MKSVLRLISVLFVLSATTITGWAQITAELWTDNSEYGPEEPIIVQLLLTNTGNEVVILTTFCNAPTFSVDDIDLDYQACIPETYPFYFSPGSWRSWTWILDPNQLALPRTDGQHSLTARFAHFVVKTDFSAPKSQGGRANIGLIASTPADTIDAFANRLNATILDQRVFSNGNINIYIQVAGIDLYEARDAFQGHPNVRYFELDQYILNVTTTDTEVETEPTIFEVSQLYPQPAHSSVSFTVSVDSPNHISIDVFDMLGRRIERYFDGFLASGNQHPFEIDISQLPPAVYFLTIKGESSLRSQALVILR